MIEFNDRTIGVWFVQLAEGGADKGSDYLASVFRTIDDDMLTTLYRFRYYRGDQSLTFEESQDEKNWYRITHPDDDEQKAIRIQRDCVKQLWMASGGKRYEVMMGSGGIDEFIERFKAMPFTTMREEKISD